jgi:hypothetical protein
LALITGIAIVHTTGMPVAYSFELVQFMAEMDYVVYELLTLDKEGRDEDGTLRWFDVVFANKKLINKPNFWY